MKTNEGKGEKESPSSGSSNSSNPNKGKPYTPSQRGLRSPRSGMDKLPPPLPVNPDPLPSRIDPAPLHVSSIRQVNLTQTGQITIIHELLLYSKGGFESPAGKQLKQLAPAVQHRGTFSSETTCTVMTGEKLIRMKITTVVKPNNSDAIDINENLFFGENVDMSHTPIHFEKTLLSDDEEPNVTPTFDLSAVLVVALKQRLVLKKGQYRMMEAIEFRAGGSTGPPTRELIPVSTNVTSQDNSNVAHQDNVQFRERIFTGNNVVRVDRDVAFYFLPGLYLTQKKDYEPSHQPQQELQQDRANRRKSYEFSEYAREGSCSPQEKITRAPSQSSVYLDTKRDTSKDSVYCVTAVEHSTRTATSPYSLREESVKETTSNRLSRSRTVKMTANSAKEISTKSSATPTKSVKSASTHTAKSPSRSPNRQIVRTKSPDPNQTYGPHGETMNMSIAPHPMANPIDPNQIYGPHGETLPVNETPRAAVSDSFIMATIRSEEEENLKDTKTARSHTPPARSPSNSGSRTPSRCNNTKADQTPPLSPSGTMFKQKSSPLRTATQSPSFTRIKTMQKTARESWTNVHPGAQPNVVPANGGKSWMERDREEMLNAQKKGIHTLDNTNENPQQSKLPKTRALFGYGTRAPTAPTSKPSSRATSPGPTTPVPFRPFTGVGHSVERDDPSHSSLVPRSSNSPVRADEMSPAVIPEENSPVDEFNAARFWSPSESTPGAARDGNPLELSNTARLTSSPSRTVRDDFGERIGHSQLHTGRDASSRQRTAVEGSPMKGQTSITVQPHKKSSISKRIKKGLSGVAKSVSKSLSRSSKSKKATKSKKKNKSKSDLETPRSESKSSVRTAIEFETPMAELENFGRNFPKMNTRPQQEDSVDQTTIQNPNDSLLFNSPGIHQGKERPFKERHMLSTLPSPKDDDDETHTFQTNFVQNGNAPLAPALIDEAAMMTTKDLSPYRQMRQETNTVPYDNAPPAPAVIDEADVMNARGQSPYREYHIERTTTTVAYFPPPNAPGFHTGPAIATHVEEEYTSRIIDPQQPTQSAAIPGTSPDVRTGIEKSERDNNRPYREDSPESRNSEDRESAGHDSPAKENPGDTNANEEKKEKDDSSGEHSGKEEKDKNEAQKLPAVSAQTIQTPEPAPLAKVTSARSPISKKENSGREDQKQMTKSSRPPPAPSLARSPAKKDTMENPESGTNPGAKKATSVDKNVTPGSKSKSPSQRAELAPGTPPPKTSGSRKHQRNALSMSLCDLLQTARDKSPFSRDQVQGFITNAYDKTVQTARGITAKACDEITALSNSRARTPSIQEDEQFEKVATDEDMDYKKVLVTKPPESETNARGGTPQVASAATAAHAASAASPVKQPSVYLQGKGEARGEIEAARINPQTDEGAVSPSNDRSAYMAVPEGETPSKRYSSTGKVARSPKVMGGKSSYMPAMPDGKGPNSKYAGAPGTESMRGQHRNMGKSSYCSVPESTKGTSIYSPSPYPLYTEPDPATRHASPAPMTGISMDAVSDARSRKSGVKTAQPNSQDSSADNSTRSDRSVKSESGVSTARSFLDWITGRTPTKKEPPRPTPRPRTTVPSSAKQVAKTGQSVTVHADHPDGKLKVEIRLSFRVNAPSGRARLTGEMESSLKPLHVRVNDQTIWNQESAEKPSDNTAENA